MNIKEKIKTNKKTLAILLAIIVVGIFLRTYHFTDWLYFAYDQARDASLSEAVVKGNASWPLLGPNMLYTNFDLGPMYYYFQIISAKIAGATPQAMAFPDLIFSILAIPLLFLFLRRLFSPTISLTLTGLYSISFFAVKFSRFAWNINPIPFFALLFLLSLHEFLIKKEKTGWKWIVFLGISIGVGAQLHVLLMLTMLLVSLLALVYMLKANRQTWKKWAIIFALSLILNTGQIVSEVLSGFSNSKNFVAAFVHRTGAEDKQVEIFKMIGRDIDCHIQYNFHVASSLASDDFCDFDYTNFFSKLDKNKKYLEHPLKYASENSGSLATLIVATLFSIFGYAAIIYYFRQEKNREKKVFLALIFTYCTVYFFVMLPVNRLLKMRYFMSESFIAFIFLGLLLKYLIDRRYTQKYILPAMLVMAIAWLNLSSIIHTARDLNAGYGSRPENPILGEMKAMAGYMQSKIYPEKEVLLAGAKRYMLTFYDPLVYVGNHQELSIKKPESLKKLDPGTKFFFIDEAASDKKPLPSEKDGFKIEDYRKFGKIGIYELQSN
jgi:4-amino-4-deoxy-L-arabinose transferase-like glycosyltransferase